MKTKMMMLCLTLISWGAFAQHDHAGMHDKKNTDKEKMSENMIMFKDAKLETAYKNYIVLKDALVSSNKDEAKNAAIQLQKSMEGVADGKMVADEAGKLASAGSLDEQRKAFSDVSNMMAMLLKGGKLSMGMIYVEYCPMAKASWLSNEKEIKNPYYGDQMLNCGSVKEMIH